MEDHKSWEKRPSGRPSTTTTQNTEATIPNTEKKQPTVETLLNDIGNPKSDAPSFGAAYNRPHDGGTAQTSKHNDKDDASLSSHDSEEQQSVTFANIPTMQNQHRITTEDNSTAKSSTHYRLQRDKSREMAAKSQEESQKLLEALRLEREELQKARKELDQLRLGNLTRKVTPSAKQGTTGTAADSAGQHG